MRFLHTSDWHLGRSFGPVALRSDQEALCDHIVTVAKNESIDLVVIAGDVFDRAVAPTESIELFRETVRRLRDVQVVVAVITGNHDGADRVAPYDDLLDLSGVYVRGGYNGIGRVITHTFEDGPLDLVLLPFLDPQAAPSDFGNPTGGDELERRRRRSHQSVLTEAISEVGTNLNSARSLAVSHAFVTGGKTSESERQLEVGGTGAVEAGLFDQFSYTALGHLHRPQNIGRPTLRYSGSPLPYSFSEDHQKSLTLVDMEANGDCTVESLELSVGRAVATVIGPIADLLEPQAHPEAGDCFVRAIVTDRETVLDAKVRLEAIYPHIVEVRLEPEEGPDGAAAGTHPSIDKISPQEAAMDFWAAVEGSPADEDTEVVLHQAITAALRVAP